MMTLYDYDAWPSRAGNEGWVHGTQPGASQWGNMDFHVDLGSGTVPKGRIGVDRFAHPSVAVVAEFGGPHGARTFATPAAPGQEATVNTNVLDQKGLPFETSSIKSIISHHALEHVGDGFIQLIDEVWRVLEPGGIFYAITPLFPSTAAVQDPDHVRYFMAHDTPQEFCTWDAFCSDDLGVMSSDSFSVPYTKARFRRLEMQFTPPTEGVELWSFTDHRELRVVLQAIK